MEDGGGTCKTRLYITPTLTNFNAGLLDDRSGANPERPTRLCDDVDETFAQKAAFFVVCAPLVMEEISFEIHRRGCVIYICHLLARYDCFVNIGFSPKSLKNLCSVGNFSYCS